MRVLADLRVPVAGGGVEDAWIAVDGERIVDVGRGAAPAGDAEPQGGLIALPGFVDLHCHGGGGGAFTVGSTDEARAAAALHLAHGTTTMLASLVTASRDDIEAGIDALAPLVDDGVLHGIHLEGPWISPAHPGAQQSAAIRALDTGELDALLERGGGRIAMVTLAPELPGALAAIPRIVAAGAVVAIGHTGADAATTTAAIDAGATLGTHLFNAMPPLHHRAPGPVGALLVDPRATVELIADLHHVDPVVLALAIRAAGPDRVALVTDAISAAGAGDGALDLGGVPVVVEGGVARMRDGGALAGSTLTLDAAVRGVVAAAGIDLADAARMAAGTPARVLGLDDRGALAPGLRADIVLVDDELAVRRVLRGGVDV